MADYYDTLAVAHDASDDEIKKSYRKLAMTYHPDRNNGSRAAEEQFKAITEAYDVLRDPQRRAAYDRYGDAGLRGAGGAEWHHVDLNEALNIFMRDFAGFSEFFGGAAGASTGPRGGADVKVDVPLTLAEVQVGVEKTLLAKLLGPCDRCNTTGAEPGTRMTKCPTCSGTGEIRRAQRSFFGQFVSAARCSTCNGEGVTIASPCKTCKGEGRMRVEKTLTVRIPPGVATGQYMTLRGQGNVGARGGPHGDIVVLFDVEDDPRFERDGEDLFTELLLTYPQMALGADVQVPLVVGETMLRIPAGSQSGQLFVLRTKGLPRVNASGVGDLHVRVQMWTPTELSPEEERLIEQLRELRPAVAQPRNKSFWSKMKDALRA